MTNTVRIAIVVGLVGWAPARLRPAIPAVTLGLWSPLLGVSATLVRWMRARAVAAGRRSRGAVDDQVDLLAELLGLGLSAGWGFSQALRWAGSRLGQPVAGEVAALVRRMHLDGAVALDGAGGHGADLYRLVARAQATGAPLVEAVDAFAADRIARRRRQTLTAARRLPVILVFPLALLILPGFVLVTVAPTLLGALERIGS